MNQLTLVTTPYVSGSLAGTYPWSLPPDAEGQAISAKLASARANSKKGFGDPPFAQRNPGAQTKNHNVNTARNRLKQEWAQLVKFDLTGIFFRLFLLPLFAETKVNNRITLEAGGLDGGRDYAPLLDHQDRSRIL